MYRPLGGWQVAVEVGALAKGLHTLKAEHARCSSVKFALAAMTEERDKLKVQRCAYDYWV
jgi:hypothetical protein